MKATGFLILVLTGVSSCKHQNESQLNRVLVESTESIQYVNSQIHTTAKERAYELKFELQSVQRNGQQTNGYVQLSGIYKRYLHIDSICDLELMRLDTLKSDLLHMCGIDKSVLSKSCFPQSIDFSRLTHKQLKQQVGDFFLNEQSRGEGIYLSLKSFRNQLTASVGSYERNGKFFQVDPGSINLFETKKELQPLVEKMIDESCANLKEDRQTLIDVYMRLSYPEVVDHLPWAQTYFDESSLLSALTVITKLQNDILNAKQLAVSHVLSFGCMASYPFNEVIPVAVGPLTATTEDTIELKITMGAFDTYNTPVVKVENRSGYVYYPGDGTGRVRLKLTKGVHLIRGTIGIQNKSGIYKTEDWEYQINVSDYDNIVISQYDDKTIFQ